MKKFLVVISWLPSLLCAQHAQPDAAQIKQNLKRLNFLGSVMYVAAHPDDENTRVIACLVGERLATTAYLSMTRGDGGQNLIGPEMRDLLGVIRTQELVTARKIDGGQQFFTRAIDFGYSKSADETFKLWGRDEILSDVIKIFRQFQPDVIMTRFPPDQRAGHGQHTASAVLAMEAFDKAGLKDVYPDQLKGLAVWQPKRIYINTGRFFNNSLDENTPGITTLNVGGYNPLLGTSYSEIAAASRSQHKSQGFGATSRRGDASEFFDLQKGEAASGDIFDGVNTTWLRVKGGDKVKPLVDQAIREFSIENPSASVPLLLRIRKAITATEPGVWRTRKIQEVEKLITDCLGFFAEFSASSYWASPGHSVILDAEIINRSAADIIIQQIVIADLKYDSTLTTKLENNVPLFFKISRSLIQGKSYSDPYWLQRPHEVGLFNVPDSDMIGKPENDPAVSVAISLLVHGEVVGIQVPVSYKWTDPVKGELHRPFEVVPPVFVNLSEQVLVFRDEQPKSFAVTIKLASDKPLTGKLELSLPTGWRSEPDAIPINLSRKNEEQIYSFTLYPSPNEMTGVLRAQLITTDQKVYNKSLQVIDYEHIPVQTILPQAEASLVRINLKKDGNRIGYIKGAGDDIPVALRNMGYDVWEMKNEEIIPDNLKQLDAVVLGVRAFNTNERLRFLMSSLLSYVREGGTLVVQYNTTIDLGSTYVPFPLKISRDRVAEEDAPVRFIKPEHRVLNYPNRITQADFEGWIQERGLYFPNSWSNEYEAILSMNDTNEDPKEGSLLVAKYGKGYYVYTGLSFFRELPDGVAGAYKLFANLVSLRDPAPVTSQPSKKKRK